MRIEDLKASIDTMLGAEDMVEHLSERNLRLSEVITTSSNFDIMFTRRKTASRGAESFC